MILNTNDKLVDDIIIFFTAQVTDPLLFSKIQEICTAYGQKYKKQNAESFIQMGYLSGFDFLNYMTETKKIGNGIRTRFVEIALEQMVKNYIISPMDSIIINNQVRSYKANGEYTKMLFQKKLIKNLIYGFNYIIDRYKNSVVKIEHINKDGDHSIGTGFLTTEIVNNNHVIVTNKHVIEKSKQIIVYTKDDIELKIVDSVKDKTRDIALVFIKDLFGDPFFLSSNLNIMTEIITIGYPTIPTTKYAYQVYHKGEVNSFVQDYWDNKLFLISAKTSSGNSGSPIIDNTGMVVGIITEELFEKDKFFEKGKLPYYAGIPTNEILESINEFKQNCG